MDWIEKSYQDSKQLRTHYKMREIDIFIKDALPKHINPDEVFKFISNVYDDVAELQFNVERIFAEIVTDPTFKKFTSPVVEFTVAIELSLEEYTIGRPEILGIPVNV